ncbi:hypothetical protein ABTN08_19300, partial [Acinetobacter baumannii]
LRTVLRDYRQAVTVQHPGLGVSTLDVLRALTELAGRPTPPTTSARFDVPTLERLGRHRDGAAKALAAAARLGEFRFGPDDSPWYGVSFTRTD